MGRQIMDRKWLSAAAVVVLLGGGLSCARNQHLVSLQIQPSGGANFGAADSTLFVNFAAYGTFEHPPQTKDLTNQVTWISDTPQVAIVNANGIDGEVSPAGTDCGSSNVTATFKDGDNLVVSSAAHIVVDGPMSSGCMQAGTPPVLQVNFAGTGLGTLSSTPAGINCNSPNSCQASFTAGTTVTLMESPVGSSTFGTWNGCSSITANNECLVVLEQNVTVTATFN